MIGNLKFGLFVTQERRPGIISKYASKEVKRITKTGILTKQLFYPKMSFLGNIVKFRLSLMLLLVGKCKRHVISFLLIIRLSAKL